MTDDRQGILDLMKGLFIDQNAILKDTLQSILELIARECKQREQEIDALKREIAALRQSEKRDERTTLQ